MTTKTNVKAGGKRTPVDITAHNFERRKDMKTKTRVKAGPRIKGGADPSAPNHSPSRRPESMLGPSFARQGDEHEEKTNVKAGGAIPDGRFRRAATGGSFSKETSTMTTKTNVKASAHHPR